MNIAIDARSLGRKKAGVSTYVAEIIEYLNDNDKENKYYLYTNREINIDFKLNDNFKIVKYNSRIGTLGVRYKLPKILVNDKIDVFWGPEHCIPKTNKVKTIVTIHDLAIFKIKGVGSFYNTIINKIFTKKSAKEADKIIAISECTKNDLVNMFKIAPSKISVVYNAESLYKYYKIDNKVENLEFSETNKKYQINSQYCLFVGTIEPRKNLINCIKAFDDFKSKTNSKYKFVIAGGKGWKTTKIYEQIEKSKFKDDIILTGYVTAKDKELLYRNANFLMFPSLYEGFGLPIIESLSVGTPVLTSNVSAMPEVGGNVSYYVNNPRDYIEISNMINKIVYDIDYGHIEEEKLVNQSKKFTKKECVEKTLKVLMS